MARSRPEAPGRACLFAVLVGIVGTACGSSQTCDVADLVTEHLVGVEATDCGSYQVRGDDDDAELEEAHDCVQGALDERAPFVVVWSYPGTEGTATRAYVGLESASGLELTRYHRSADNTGNYGTGRSTCGQLTPMISCDVGQLRSFLCFECDGPGPPEAICDADS